MAKKDKVKLAYEQDDVLEKEITNEINQEEKDFQDNLDTEIEKTNAELDNSINATKQNVQTAVGAANIGAVYNPAMTSLGNKITEMEEAKKKAKEGDETAQRRARSMKMVAGISDGLASLANLIGVGSYGASNINTGSALTPLEQKMEAARLERKADIKSIDDRLDQYRNQLDQIRMQKGSALANYYQQKENRRYESEQAEKKMLANLSTTEAKLRSTAMENALNRANQLDIAKIRAKATTDAANTRATTESKKSKEQFILTDAEGNETVYSMPKETAAAMLRDFDAIIQSDIANDTTSGVTSSAFRQAYERYQDVLSKRSVGMGSEKEVTDARNALISLSPTMQEKIKQYGTSGKASSSEEGAEGTEELDEIDALLESHK